jgi:hypothetical protein
MERRTIDGWRAGDWFHLFFKDGTTFPTVLGRVAAIRERCLVVNYLDLADPEDGFTGTVFGPGEITPATPDHAERGVWYRAVAECGGLMFPQEEDTVSQDNTLPSQPPSVGRIVHYSGDLSDVEGGAPRATRYAAIITDTYQARNEPELVDLTVFPPASEGGTPVAYTGIAYDADGKPGTWCYPAHVPARS